MKVEQHEINRTMCSIMSTSIDTNMTPNHTKLTTHQSYMSYVVPDISDVVIISETECSLKAGQCHVVLLGIETTQAQVVEQLGVAHTHL